MRPARHWYRGDDHPIEECTPDRCQQTAERMKIVAEQIAAIGGQCGCGRVVGPRCFKGIPRWHHCPLED